MIYHVITCATFYESVHIGPYNSDVQSCGLLYCYKGTKFLFHLHWLLFPCNLGIHCRKKYGLFEKHNGNTRIWQFKLLEMAWFQPQTGIVALMQHSRVVLWTKDAIYIYMHTHINQYDSYLIIFCTITCRYDFNWRFRVPGDDTRTTLLTN